MNALRFAQENLPLNGWNAETDFKFVQKSSGNYIRFAEDSDLIFFKVERQEEKIISESDFFGIFDWIEEESDPRFEVSGVMEAEDYKSNF